MDRVGSAHQSNRKKSGKDKSDQTPAMIHAPVGRRSLEMGEIVETNEEKFCFLVFFLIKGGTLCSRMLGKQRGLETDQRQSLGRWEGAEREGLCTSLPKYLLNFTAGSQHRAALLATNPAPISAPEWNSLG